MPEHQQLEIRTRCEHFGRDARKTSSLIASAIAPARVRALRCETRTEIRMQPAKGAYRPRCAQHPTQYAVAAIFTRPQAVSVLDARLPSRNRTLPRPDVIVDADVASQHVAAPTIVIAGDHENVGPGFAKLGERRQDAEARSRDHRAPFEPELEQIAIDDERARVPLQTTEEPSHVTLDGSIRKAEMQIGDDVARWREHALILAGHSQLYKGRLPVQSSRLIDMSSDSESTLRPAHDLELRVRYAETDQMGVVYHANYLVWCEMGRTDFIRRCGRSYADLERDGISLAVSELSARYHAAARYDDLIRVRTSLGEVRSRMISFDYLISDAVTNKRLVSAHTTLISLDGNGRPVALPSELRRLLR